MVQSNYFPLLITYYPHFLGQFVYRATENPPYLPRTIYCIIFSHVHTNQRSARPMHHPSTQTNDDRLTIKATVDCTSESLHELLHPRFRKKTQFSSTVAMQCKKTLKSALYYCSGKENASSTCALCLAQNSTTLLFVLQYVLALRVIVVVRHARHKKEKP